MGTGSSNEIRITQTCELHLFRKIRDDGGVFLINIHTSVFPAGRPVCFPRCHLRCHLGVLPKWFPKHFPEKFHFQLQGRKSVAVSGVLLILYVSIFPSKSETVSES